MFCLRCSKLDIYSAHFLQVDIRVLPNTNEQNIPPSDNVAGNVKYFKLISCFPGTFWWVACCVLKLCHSITQIARGREDSNWQMASMMSAAISETVNKNYQRNTHSIVSFSRARFDDSNNNTRYSAAAFAHASCRHRYRGYRRYQSALLKLY